MAQKFQYTGSEGFNYGHHGYLEKGDVILIEEAREISDTGRDKRFIKVAESVEVSEPKSGPAPEKEADEPETEEKKSKGKGK